MSLNATAGKPTKAIVQNLNFESKSALINAEILVLAQKKGYLIKDSRSKSLSQS